MNETLHWLVQDQSDIPEDDNWLSDAEKDILSGFRFPKRRNDWRVGRWTVKQAICAYQSLKNPILPYLEIRAAEDGAPEAFWNGKPAEISISISHSQGRGFCAVGPANFSIGCDTELIEPREVQFFQDYFTPEEIALMQNGSAEKNLVAYLIWCAKESMLKALRQGLRMDTRSVIVSPDFHERPDLWNTWTGRCLESSRSFSGWWCVRDGCVYAMTADQPTSSPIHMLKI